MSFCVLHRSYSRSSLAGFKLPDKVADKYTHAYVCKVFTKACSEQKHDSAVSSVAASCTSNKVSGRAYPFHVAQTDTDSTISAQDQERHQGFMRAEREAGQVVQPHGQSRS